MSFIRKYEEFNKECSTKLRSLVLEELSDYILIVRNILDLSIEYQDQSNLKTHLLISNGDGKKFISIEIKENNVQNISIKDLKSIASILKGKKEIFIQIEVKLSEEERSILNKSISSHLPNLKNMNSNRHTITYKVEWI